MTVVTNDNNELIPTQTVTGWRVCMDYRKLNKVTRKDHFPLPFLDQMLDRLAGRAFYCFLDGYFGYNQILIALEDQEKTTFTCPYGTFAFSRMPFGMRNAPVTFQRCTTPDWLNAGVKILRRSLNFEAKGWETFVYSRVMTTRRARTTREQPLLYQASLKAPTRTASTSVDIPPGPSTLAEPEIPSSRAYPVTAHRLSQALLSIKN
uniref:Reverse transcriptase domain-containing protein n=1 Tax=Nicotiana tabacum TaxID=4097 RepID=A0A1S3ZXH1_TOBAC|nr:PREDICTED: uncharacterized protein LOC107791434 [Nicotiana tabacum]